LEKRTQEIKELKEMILQLRKEIDDLKKGGNKFLFSCPSDLVGEGSVACSLEARIRN
jgi:hypothetical protein